MDGGEKVLCGLVVASGDGPELLETTEEILNQMAMFVKLSVVIAHLRSIFLGRYDGDLAGGSKRGKHPLVSVKGLVGNDDLRLDRGQKVIRAVEIMRLTRAQQKISRITQRINAGMDLCAQPAAGAPDRLVAAVFFRAPALC